MSEIHKQTSRRWLEAWATDELPGACAQALTSDFRAHVPGHGWVDRDRYARSVRSALGPFASARLTVEEAAAEGDAVLLCLNWNGPHGTLLGFAIDRFRDGRVAEHILLLDRLAARRDGLPAASPERPFGARRRLDRLPLRTTGRVRFLQVAEIEWVDAAHNYVRIHTTDGKIHVAREAIGELENRLDPERFLRIHRSTIINTDCVRELELSSYGNYVAILASGQRVTISRSFRDRVPALLGA
jgi:hypothetical protein